MRSATVTLTGTCPVIRRSRACSAAAALVVLLLATSLFGAKPADPDAPDRVVVVGDVHGDYKRLTEVLALAGVVDGRGRWIAGSDHLVQLGDLPDRGDDTLKVIEFLRKLEKGARRKGGAVHILIGNHEAMNGYGDLRYVTDGEYRAFADRDSLKRLEQLYRDQVQWIRENVPEEEWPEFDAEFREEWFARRPPGFLEHRWSWLPDGEIGEWVLTRPALLKIGRSLFVHGGIGPAYANWTIEQLNTAVTEALKDVDNVENTILRDEQGPLWYRGLALHPEEREVAHLETLLENFGVDRIILGHTVTGGVIVPRFGGRVLLADVGLSGYYGNCLACLIIENDKVFAQYRNGRIQIPVGEGTEGLLKYLKTVREQEGDNPHLKSRIDAIENPAPVEEPLGNLEEVPAS